MALHPTSQHSLARRAFWRASDELLQAMNAGTISPQDAAAKHRKLHAAYRRRRDRIELASFLGSRGFASLVPNIVQEQVDGGKVEHTSTRAA